MKKLKLAIMTLTMVVAGSAVWANPPSAYTFWWNLNAGDSSWWLNWWLSIHNVWDVMF